MQSEQEKIVAEFMAHSMGAPFIFEPQEFKKPNGKIREPLDLAWVCDETAILICMTTKNKAPEKINKHNIGQLMNWMAKWSKGQPLVGKNEFQEFYIPYDQIKHVIFVSVGQSENIRASFLNDELESIKIKYPQVVGCLSVHDSSIKLLAKCGASIIDFLEFIWGLRHSKTPLPEKEANENIRRAHWFSSHRAVDRRTRKDIDVVKNCFLGVRSQNIDLCRIFNDMNWQSTYNTCAILAEIIRKIEGVPEGARGVRAAALLHYVNNRPFILGVRADDNNQEALKKYTDSVIAKMDILEKENPLYPPIFINFGLLFDNTSLFPMVVWNGHKGVSYRETLLQNSFNVFSVVTSEQRKQEAVS